MWVAGGGHFSCLMKLYSRVFTSRLVKHKLEERGTKGKWGRMVQKDHNCMEQPQEISLYYEIFQESVASPGVTAACTWAAAAAQSGFLFCYTQCLVHIGAQVSVKEIKANKSLNVLSRRALVLFNAASFVADFCTCTNMNEYEYEIWKWILCTFHLHIPFLF